MLNWIWKVEQRFQRYKTDYYLSFVRNLPLIGWESRMSVGPLYLWRGGKARHFHFISKTILPITIWKQKFIHINGLKIQDVCRAAVSKGGGSKAPSLLFHLKNNTSLYDMETKLYTHIRKTLAMLLIKKLYASTSYQSLFMTS